MKPVEIEFLMKGNLGRGLDDARRKAESLDSVLRNVGAAVGIAFGTRQAMEFARKVMDVRGEVESLQISFETLAGKAKGRKLFGDIREWVVNTPMMMQPVAKGAQTLLGFNIEAEKVMPILRQIGDISMGDAQKFNSLTLAFAQMSSTGKLMGQDLLQMINAGFNPLVVISEKTGKSMATLKKEMADGKITVKMVEEAFASATAEGGRFHGMLEKQSKGIQGAMSNLQGAWDDMLNDIGEKSQGVMVNAINQATELVKDYDKVLDVLEEIVVAYGSYKAALMLVVAAQKAMAIAENIRLVMMFRKEMGLLTAAQQAFNRAALVNPYVLIGVAAAGAGVAIYKMAAADDAAEAAQKKLNQTMEDANQLAKDHQRELDELTRKATSEAASTDDRRTAMQQLVDKYPSIIQKYIDEKGHLTDIINLKREIARLDGQEKAGQLEEQTRKAKRYLELYDKSRKGIQLSDGERKLLNNLADEVWDQQSWWTQTKSGSRGKFVADYYQGMLPSLERSSARTKTENMLREYNNGLEKMTDDELVKMSKDAQDALRKIGDRNSAFLDSYTHDYVTKGDLGERLGIIGNILEQRHPKKDDGGGSGSGKTDKLLKEQREQAAKAIEEERRWEEEISRMKRDSSDASRDAEIAAIKDDGERERAEQEEQHKRNLRQIQEQANEMKKAIYEHNKTVWENSHKDSPYELTEAGKAGWSAIQLSQDQQAIIDAKTRKENEEYNRQVREQRQADLQSMRNYIQEYGTSLQQQLSIVEEYDEKIKNAGSGNKWETKRLEKERDRSLASVKANTLAMDIDWSKTFTSIGGVLEDIAKETYDKVKAYMESDDFKKLDANNKQAYSDLMKDLKSAGGLKKASWDELSKSINDYKRYVKEFKDATQSHEDAYKHYEEANKEYIDAIESGASATEIAIKERNKQEAEAVLEATGEVVKEIKDKMTGSGNTLTETNEALWKSLDNFENTINQITSGSLSGAVLGIGNLIKIIKGDSNIASRVGELFGATATKLGQVIEAILAILDTVGDDPSGFFEDLLNKIFDAIAGIIDDLGSGELARALSRGIFNGIMKVFDSIANNLSLKSGAFLGFGLVNTFRTEDDGKNSYGNVKQKYEDLVDIWDQLLEKKKEYLSMSWGNEAIQAEEDAQKLLEIEEERTKMMAKRRLGEGASSGSHSYWYRMWQGSYASKAEENKALNYVGSPYEGWISWGDVNEKIVRELYKEGLGAAQFNSMYDLVDMSAEQLAWIKENYAGLWASMDSDFRDYLEKLIEYGDQESEIFEKLQEQLTTTTEDNVFSQYLDYLYKFADGVEDVTDEVADDWQKMVNRMIINNIIGEMFRENLKKWYDKLYQANKALTETGDEDAYRQTLEELKKDYQTYIDDGRKEIEQLREMGIISATGENAGQSQTAKTGGFSAMSQDQGTKLDGMFTAGLQHWSSMDKELTNVSDRLGTALDRLKRIEENTEYCRKLDIIAEDINHIKSNGVKIR